MIPFRAWVSLNTPPARVAVWVLPTLPVLLVIVREPCSASISDPVGICRASVSGTKPWPLASALRSPAPSDLPGGSKIKTCPDTGATFTALPSTGGGGADGLAAVMNV